MLIEKWKKSALMMFLVSITVYEQFQISRYTKKITHHRSDSRGARSIKRRYNSCARIQLYPLSNVLECSQQSRLTRARSLQYARVQIHRSISINSINITCRILQTRTTHSTIQLNIHHPQKQLNIQNYPIRRLVTHAARQSRNTRSRGRAAQVVYSLLAQ